MNEQEPPSSAKQATGGPSLVMLGTGTSVGVPVVGCDCDVCTSGHPRNQRTRAGVLVRAPEGEFVIDTPPELRLQLLREKARAIHAAFFTHGHADHIMGLDDLRIFGYRLDKSIPLYCEPLVEEQLRKTFHYAFATGKPAHRFAVPRLHFEPIAPLEPIQLLGLEVKPIRLMHGKLPICGFRIGNVAYCTDVSTIPKETHGQLDNLDVLIIDALRHEPHPTHMSVKQAVSVIRKVKAKRGYLTHLSCRLDYEKTTAELPENIELAYDGLEIPLFIQ